MKRILASAFFALGLSSAVGFADEAPVVVELFTSQGCSSCPPADRLLGDLANEEGVIALSLHVDYWDYIGWEDQLAQPQFTKRQKYYAHAMGEKMIYTPQIIINGETHLVGSNSSAVRDMIESQDRSISPLSLAVERAGEGVVINVVPKSAALPEMDVHLVQYLPEISAEITRGENAGKVIVYSNAVQHWTNIGRWTGRGDLTVEAPAVADLPIVVLLQTAGYGPIIAAVEID